MSFDLYFSGDVPSHNQFAGYFADRPHYTLQENQAWYENADTGVYFSFELLGDDDDEAAAGCVAFNMNYFRPHIFGLEAAGEVDRFVQEFRPEIHDPQNDGMGDGPFSVEGFLKSWNAGNEFGYRAMLGMDEPPEPFVLSTQALEETWRWNFGRNDFQDDVDFAFVPSFMFLKDGRDVRATVVWGDAIPIMLPHADWYIIVREDLKLDPSVEREYALATFEDVRPLMRSFPQETRGIPYWDLEYEDPPQQVVDFVRSLPTVELGSDRGLAVDQVLNRELVEQARR